MDQKALVVYAIALLMISQPASKADFMDVPDMHVQYSKERANTAIYGTSLGGLLMESSQLRLEAETLRTKQNFDEAILKARKAAQLDPKNPESHVVLARCLTDKLYANNLEATDADWKRCIDEWKVVLWHFGDDSEQSEATRNLLKLKRDKFTQKFRKKKHDREVQALMVAGKKDATKTLDKMLHGY